ncbi:hypothetical protein RRG08_005997 [Elysia crispata]|uniref:Uncharacterized protein n=1 Tax=Elysia crispata TaxID=231223 RepID=A0AAE1CMY3_9GAST|nr:hypothetical protein RRG08_005997 [Elysia crispata]
MLGEEFVMAGTVQISSYLLFEGYTGYEIVTLSNLTEGRCGKSLWWQALHSLGIKSIILAIWTPKFAVVILRSRKIILILCLREWTGQLQQHFVLSYKPTQISLRFSVAALFCFHFHWFPAPPSMTITNSLLSVVLPLLTAPSQNSCFTLRLLLTSAPSPYFVLSTVPVPFSSSNIRD